MKTLDTKLPTPCYKSTRVIGPLGDGSGMRELERRLDAYWRQSVPLAKVNRFTRWRRYADLSPGQKRAIRRRWVKGEAVGSIAVSAGVYAGTILRASEDGGWRRERGRPKTTRQRIEAALRANPTLSNAEVVALVGASSSYVSHVRRKGGRS